jgi:hypothetical protein
MLREHPLVVAVGLLFFAGGFLLVAPLLTGQQQRVSLLKGKSLLAVPILSPSGAFSARTEISGDEAGPTRRLCVRLRVTNIPAKREIAFQTGASDVQKWAVGWSPSNSLVLYSSDVGIMAYDIKDGQMVERMPDAAEQEVARKAYEQKYGTKPRD